MHCFRTLIEVYKTKQWYFKLLRFGCHIFTANNCDLTKQIHLKISKVSVFIHIKDYNSHMSQALRFSVITEMKLYLEMFVPSCLYV